MKHNKRKRKAQRPCFVFTFETVDLTLRALKLFEQPLSRANHQQEKVVFAEETFQQVKTKLTIMRQSVGSICQMTFDYNEKIILTQAVRMYAFELQCMGSGARRTKELHYCQQLVAFFSRDTNLLH